MEATTTRLFTTVNLVTCAAWAKSASVAALSPASQSKTVLLGTLAQTGGAPASVAVARSVVLGSVL